MGLERFWMLPDEGLAILLGQSMVLNFHQDFLAAFPVV